MLLVIGALLYGCVAHAVKDQKLPPPFSWHYIGPESKADLVKQAVDVLIEDCPGLYPYDEYFHKPDITWRVINRSDPLWRLGVRAAVNVSARFKPQPIDSPPAMPLYPEDKFGDAERLTLVLVGPPANTIVLSGKGAFALCEVTDPPIGDAPVLKPEPRLAGLAP